MWVGIGLVVLVAVLTLILYMRFGHQPTVPDAEIEKSIRARLAGDPDLTKCAITVKSEDGIVTLTGLVSNVSDRSAASRIVLEQPGVKTIVDDLKTTTSQITDSQGEGESNNPGQSASVKTVIVAGERPWTDTGIDLGAGDTVSVNASGSVSFSRGGEAIDASGDQPSCMLNRNPRVPYVAPELRCHSLIGRIGPSGPSFEVGSSGRFQAQLAGRLYLGVNDNFFPDNSGGWTAIISDQASASGTVISEQIPSLGTQRLNAAPLITSVSPIGLQAVQTIVIHGSGFGTQAPYDGDSPSIMISDLTRNWRAGCRSRLECGRGDNRVKLRVSNWSDTEVRVDRFTGAYAPMGPFFFNLGDRAKVWIWNVQNGAGPATYELTVGRP
jgi:hypothetical protein